MVIYSVYLIVYLLLAIFRPITNNLEDKEKKKAYFFVMLPIFLLIAFRAETVGADTYSYAYLFDRYGNKSFQEILQTDTWLEIGYTFSNRFFHQLGFTYNSFQVLVTAFYFFSFYKFFLKYSTSIEFSCFLLIARQGMFGMMNQTRMWIATCIMLFAADAIINKRTFKFIVLIIIASFFHKSVICLLLLYFIAHKKSKQFVFGVFLMSSVMICLVGTSFFNWLTNLLGLYETTTIIQDNIKSASIIDLMVYIFILIAVVLTRNTVLDKEKEASNNEFLVDVLICLIGLSVIGLRSNIMVRITSFFSAYLYGLIPSCVDKIPNADNKKVVFSAITIMYTALFFAIMILRPYWDRVIPYSMFF